MPELDSLAAGQVPSDPTYVSIRWTRAPLTATRARRSEPVASASLRSDPRTSSSSPGAGSRTGTSRARRHRASPRVRACWATATASSRPLAFGTETRTIVQPLAVRGHCARRPRSPAGVVGTLTLPPSRWGPARDRPPSPTAAIAIPAPPPPRRRAPRRGGEGRASRSASGPKRPRPAGADHTSRQYSCAEATGAPQRGTGRSWRRSRRGVLARPLVVVERAPAARAVARADQERRPADADRPAGGGGGRPPRPSRRSPRRAPRWRRAPRIARRRAPR